MLPRSRTVIVVMRGPPRRQPRLAPGPRAIPGWVQRRRSPNGHVPTRSSPVAAPTEQLPPMSSEAPSAHQRVSPNTFGGDVVLRLRSGALSAAWVRPGCNPWRLPLTHPMRRLGLAQAVRRSRRPASDSSVGPFGQVAHTARLSEATANRGIRWGLCSPLTGRHCISVIQSNCSSRSTRLAPIRSKITPSAGGHQAAVRILKPEAGYSVECAQQRYSM